MTRDSYSACVRERERGTECARKGARRCDILYQSSALRPLLSTDIRPLHPIPTTVPVCASAFHKSSAVRGQSTRLLKPSGSRTPCVGAPQSSSVRRSRPGRAALASSAPRPAPVRYVCRTRTAHGPARSAAAGGVVRDPRTSAPPAVVCCCPCANCSESVCRSPPEGVWYIDTSCGTCTESR